jgi:DNA-binding CsgD family transcriptional regulator
MNSLLEPDDEVRNTVREIGPLVLEAYDLTVREAQVAHLVLRGAATDDIGTALTISSLTVQQHLKAVFDKTGARSRRDLVAQIFTQQYLPRSYRVLRWALTVGSQSRPLLGPRPIMVDRSAAR